MPNETLRMENLKALGKKQGFLTYAQINDALPLSIVDPDDINAVATKLEHLGIRVVERSS